MQVSWPTNRHQWPAASMNDLGDRVVAESGIDVPPPLSPCPNQVRWKREIEAQPFMAGSDAARLCKAFADDTTDPML